MKFEQGAGFKFIFSLMDRNIKNSGMEFSYTLLKIYIPMKPKELKDIIQLKNNIIMEQSKRIRLLEEKMTEVRQKYFHLKYSDLTFQYNIKQAG